MASLSLPFSLQDIEAEIARRGIGGPAPFHEPEPWFHEGQLAAWGSLAQEVAIVAGTQGGKALDIETQIPTPNGFVPIKELRPGDQVYASDGQPTTVVGCSPIYTPSRLYLLVFDDGSEIIADADHQWSAEDSKARKNRQRDESDGKLPKGSHGAYRRTVTTEQMATTPYGQGGRANWSIPIGGGVAYPERTLPIDAYVLGAWLGDGTSRKCEITSADPEIIERIEGAGYPCVPTRWQNAGAATTYRFGAFVKDGRPGRKSDVYLALSSLSLLGNKHIPEIYKCASIEQRFALVQGLLDTDGSVDSRGHIEFSSKNATLAADLVEVLRSLGIKTRLRCNRSAIYDKDCGLRYRVALYTDRPVFWLPRKRKAQKPAIRPDAHCRFIRSFVAVQPRPVKCIAVAAEDRLYLAGRDYLVTHNTAFLPRWLRREIQRCAPLIRKIGRGDFLFVGPTLTLLETQALPTFDMAFVSDSALGRLVKGTKPKFFYSPEGGRKTVGFEAPITVHFAYANDSSNLESLTALAGGWDEAGQKENRQASYEAFNRRLKVAQSTTFRDVWEWVCEKGLQGEFAWWKARYYDVEGPEATFGRRAWGTTPYEWNWFKTLVYDVASSGRDPRWEFFNFPSWMNPLISREACEKELDHEPLWRWQMMYEGRYTKPAGLVFDCFGETNIVDDFDVPLAWRRWGGLDFGMINQAGVFWAHDPDTDTFYQTSEYHPGYNLTFEEHAVGIKRTAAVRAMGESGGSPPSQITPHCAGGNRTTEQGQRQAFRKEGIPVDEPDPKHTDPKLQYQCLYDLVKRGRLKVFRSCVKTIGQYQTFSYKLDDKNEPTEDFDHEERMHLLAGSRYLAAKVNPPRATSQRREIKVFC